MSIKKGTVTIASSTPVTEWGSIEGTLSDQTDITNALSTKAPLLSPSFTGIPTVPTASEGTNTNQVASTKFVNTAIENAMENVDALPDQTGQSGKFLKTNGTDASWANIPTELPSQSGNAGKVLSTNGTTPSWIEYTPPSNVETDDITINKNTSDELQAIGVIDKNSGTAKYDWIGTYAQWEAGRSNNTIPDSWICYITDDIHDTIVSHNIGDIFYSLRSENMFNGAVVCDGSQYNISEYSEGTESIKNLLDSGKLPYISIADFNTEVITNGSCRCFGYDGSTATVFKVPKLNDVFIEAGVSANNSEFIDAGLPNITGTYAPLLNGTDTYPSGVSSSLSATNLSGAFTLENTNNGRDWHFNTSAYQYNSNNHANLKLDASRSNSIYGNSNTVQPESVKYRAFIQLASGTTDSALQTVNSVVSDVNDLKDEIKETLQHKHITNCITEIPQDIKLELNDGTLTLKAGSKVYVPNGVDVFDDVIISNDKVCTYGTGVTGLFMVIQISNQNTFFVKPEYVTSGTTAPTVGDNIRHIWYDTTNNIVKMYAPNSSDYVQASFPIALCTSTGTDNKFSSIDQVFNGFGYIGSTIFALPGLKGLMPDGRNEDGTLKNIEYTVQSVLTVTITSSGYRFTSIEAPGIVQPYPFLTNNGFYEYFESDTQPSLERYKWFDTANNLQYWYNENDESHPEYHSLYPIKNFIICNYYFENGKITEFYPRKAFRSLDYNDKPTISGWGMPSNKYIDMTSLTYTAPANGYVYFQASSGTNNGYVVIKVNDGESYFRQVGDRNSSGSHSSSLIMPVKKGELVTCAKENSSGVVYTNRFIYAEGEV